MTAREMVFLPPLDRFNVEILVMNPLCFLVFGGALSGLCRS